MALVKTLVGCFALLVALATFYAISHSDRVFVYPFSTLPAQRVSHEVDREQPFNSFGLLQVRPRDTVEKCWAYTNAEDAQGANDWHAHKSCLYAELSVQCTLPSPGDAPVLPSDQEAFVAESAPCQACMGVIEEAGKPSCCRMLPVPTMHPYVQGQPNPYAVCEAIMAKKALVAGYRVEDEITVAFGNMWPTNKMTMSMAGLARMSNYEWLITDAVARRVPGGIIETGVWRGGMSVVGATVLRVLGAANRTTFLADSFAGIPKINVKKYPKDRVHLGSDRIPILVANSEQRQKDCLAQMGLFSLERFPIVLIKGYFEHSLPKADKEGLFDDGFAVVRLDGDTYASTMEALVVLYPRLHPGGFLIVDDFTGWAGCHAAIMDFRTKFGITTPIVRVFHRDARNGLQDGTSAAGYTKHTQVAQGAWFRKPATDPK